MASGVINGSTSNSLIKAKIEWESTHLPGLNQSAVTASLYLRRTNTGYTTQGTGQFAITIEGETLYGTNKHWTIQNEWVKVVENATAIISHDADGSKSITISASGSIPDTSLKSVSCSQTVSLDPIAPSVPTEPEITELYSENNLIENPITIKYFVPSDEYYSRLSLNASYYSGTYDIRTVDLGRVKGNGEYEAVLDDSEREKCYLSNIDDRGTYVEVTITCYSDSTYTTSIESDYMSKWMDFDEEKIKPIVTASYSPVNDSLPSDFSNLFIRGKSKVKATFSAEAKYGAYLNVSYGYLDVDGAQTTMYPGSTEIKSYGVVKGAGSVPVSVTVMDSRNITATTKDTINVLDYAPPKPTAAEGESSIICERRFYESGEPYLYVKARKNYSYLEGKNRCKLSLFYTVGDNAVENTTEYLLSDFGGIGTYDGEVSGVVPNAQYSYKIRLVATDLVGNEGETVIIIPKDTPCFVRGAGGNKASFGGYPEEENMLDVHWNQRVRGTLYLGANKQPVADYVVEQGASGIWIYRKWASGIAELWGTYTQTAKANTSWGDLYMTPYADKQTYPFAFMSRPYEIVTLHPGVSGNLMTRLANTTTQTGNYACTKTGSNSSNSNFIYDYYVVGKYK
jgi:hypothetical protein